MEPDLEWADGYDGHRSGPEATLLPKETTPEAAPRMAGGDTSFLPLGERSYSQAKTRWRTDARFPKPISDFGFVRAARVAPQKTSTYLNGPPKPGQTKTSPGNSPPCTYSGRDEPSGRGSRCKLHGTVKKIPILSTPDPGSDIDDALGSAIY